VSPPPDRGGVHPYTSSGLPPLPPPPPDVSRGVRGVSESVGLDAPHPGGVPGLRHVAERWDPARPWTRGGQSWRGPFVPPCPRGRGPGESGPSVHLFLRRSASGLGGTVEPPHGCRSRERAHAFGSPGKPLPVEWQPTPALDALWEPPRQPSGLGTLALESLAEHCLAAGGVDTGHRGELGFGCRVEAGGGHLS